MCSYLIQSIPFTLGPSASADIGSLPAATSLHSVAVTPTTPSSTPLASGWSIPSISSLMTTPITSILPVASAHLPLILSPALPPIPARLVEKIQKGSFVDMKELLGDNITLFQRMEEVHKPGSSSHQWVTTAPSPKLREVSSPLSWMSCFIAYMAVRCHDDNTRDLLIYTRLILDLARKHGGRGWLDYDRVFRQQIAANPAYSWGELNPSLMAYTVLGSDSSYNRGLWCPLCQETDHRASECALQSLEPSTSPRHAPPRSFKGRHKFDPVGLEICRKFNRGLCTMDACKYKHVCRECHEDHPFVSCPNRESKPKP